MFSNFYVTNSSAKELCDVTTKQKCYVSSTNKSYEAELIGLSPSITEIRNTAEKIGLLNMETSVLISGESGTGKEIVAKLIHSKIGKEKPFVALNCAAVPRNLQESELFGYEKGAFTGAIEEKTGLIKFSNGGIIFLDEIGDMNLELQAKMLRVLQENKYRPLGGTKEFSFSTTIISATNKDLKLEIEKGNFREDLYYRINVIPIYIPPLRERKEDVPPLIEHYLKVYNLKLNKSILNFNKDAMDIMINYNWRGNIRELKNIIERICVFQNDKTVTMEDLPRDFIEGAYAIKRTRNPLEASEVKVILQILTSNNWNILKTANELGISRSTLRRKIKKYELVNNTVPKKVSGADVSSFSVCPVCGCRNMA